MCVILCSRSLITNTQGRIVECTCHIVDIVKYHQHPHVQKIQQTESMIYYEPCDVFSTSLLTKITIVYKQYKQDCLNTSMGLFNISLLSCDVLFSFICKAWLLLKYCRIIIFIQQLLREFQYGNLHPSFK
jgi:hypothetical protein